MLQKNTKIDSIKNWYDVYITVFFFLIFYQFLVLMLVYYTFMKNIFIMNYIFTYDYSYFNKHYAYEHVFII